MLIAEIRCRSSKNQDRQLTRAQDTKRFLNDPETAVTEALSGFGAANAERIRIDLERGVVVRRNAPVPGKVGVLSGGGSGHEPLDYGYVGQGMLDAAVLGTVFTSPGLDAIMAATRAVDAGVGVVYVVKNYTGDIMNFRLAADLGSAAGIEVETVVVDDEVPLDAGPTTDRRGIGATVLVERLVGARAEQRASLTAVAEVGLRANARSRSFGIALRSCSPLTLGHPTFQLGHDEIEIGVGIHGEPGRRRGRMAQATKLVAEIADAIIADLSPEPGADLLALVNGLGATSLMELYVVYNALVAELTRRAFQISRSLVGNYVTSLDMAGVSVTLLELDDELVELWDSPVNTAALRWRA